MTHQFHQEEQKRFKEYVTKISSYTEKDKAISESFIPQSNDRAMKHILEELLAEIQEDEVYDSDQETGEPKGKYAHIVFGQNQILQRHRASITKKLQDITTEG